MDAVSMKSALESLGEVLTLLKQSKDVMPPSLDKEAAEKAIADAEEQLKIAEAQAAKELGYQLCRCTWPPQIMVAFNENRVVRCPHCKRETLSIEEARRIVERNLHSGVHNAPVSGS